MSRIRFRDSNGKGTLRLFSSTNYLVFSTFFFFFPIWSGNRTFQSLPGWWDGSVGKDIRLLRTHLVEGENPTPASDLRPSHVLRHMYICAHTHTTHIHTKLQVDTIWSLKGKTINMTHNINMSTTLSNKRKTVDTCYKNKQWRYWVKKRPKKTHIWYSDGI